MIKNNKNNKIMFFFSFDILINESTPAASLARVSAPVLVSGNSLTESETSFQGRFDIDIIAQTTPKGGDPPLFLLLVVRTPTSCVRTYVHKYTFKGLSRFSGYAV